MREERDFTKVGLLRDLTERENQKSPLGVNREKFRIAGFPGRSKFKFKIVKKTTISWGCL